MDVLKHSLSDDVLAAFKRACRENEFELANHLLSALEAMATDRHQLDAAYLTFIACCELDTRTTEPKQMGGN